MVKKFLDPWSRVKNDFFGKNFKKNDFLAVCLIAPHFENYFKRFYAFFYIGLWKPMIPLGAA